MKRLRECFEFVSPPGKWFPRTRNGWRAAFWNVRYLIGFWWYWHGPALSTQPDLLNVTPDRLTIHGWMQP